MPAAPESPGSPLAFVEAFVDQQRAVSALALAHVNADARVALLYHDAPGRSATLPLLAAVATSLHARLRPGEDLCLLETSMPEHPAETFVYAHAALRCSDLDGRIEVASLRVVAADRVARMCGITRSDLARTEQLVTAIHRPRGCAFAGFRATTVDTRPVGAGRTVAA